MQCRVCRKPATGACEECRRDFYCSNACFTKECPSGQCRRTVRPRVVGFEDLPPDMAFEIFRRLQPSEIVYLHKNRVFKHQLNEDMILRIARELRTATESSSDVKAICFLSDTMDSTAPRMNIGMFLLQSIEELMRRDMFQLEDFDFSSIDRVVVASRTTARAIATDLVWVRLVLCYGTWTKRELLRRPDVLRLDKRDFLEICRYIVPAIGNIYTTSLDHERKELLKGLFAWLEILFGHFRRFNREMNNNTLYDIIVDAVGIILHAPIAYLFISPVKEMLEFIQHMAYRELPTKESLAKEKRKRHWGVRNQSAFLESQHNIILENVQNYKTALTKLETILIVFLQINALVHQ